LSYRATKKGNYGNKRRRPRTNKASSARVKKETSWRVDLHKGLVKTEDVKMTPSPEEYIHENEKSGSVRAGFKLVDTEFTGTIGNKTKIKYPKGTDIV
jgi:hypothetical protein